MKYEWRKNEKDIYLPKNKPDVIDIPSFKYYVIKGTGNPNSDFFGECIGALYALSYGIRMSGKGGFAPEGFYEYTVYPLEGIWDISEEAKTEYNGILDKDSLVFDLMIRQPDFVTKKFAQEIIKRTMDKKPDKLLNDVKFSDLKEGKCVQMMHFGSYDDEPETFEIMEAFCNENNLQRKSKKHKEIYISDPRKTEPERLKTVLRFKVK